MKPIRRNSILTLALCVALASCADTPTRYADIEDIVGSYRLETVGGQALPGLVFEDASVTVHVAEGSLYLNPDLRFQQNYRVEQVQGEDQTQDYLNFHGAFDRDGTELILQHPNGATEYAQIDGDLVALTTLDGLVFVFRKVA